MTKDPVVSEAMRRLQARRRRHKGGRPAEPRSCLACHAILTAREWRGHPAVCLREPPPSRKMGPKPALEGARYGCPGRTSN